MKERISKSAQKRRFKQEESAAEEIALLSDKDLKTFPGSEDVKIEIKNCRGIKGGARKRQIKYLAKVMRQGSVDDILDYLAEKKGSRLKVDKIHQEAERLRDVIINEALDAQDECLQAGLPWEPNWEGEEIDMVLERYELNEGEIRKAVYQYVRTRIHSYSREIFRILKAGVEKKEFLKKSS